MCDMVLSNYRIEACHVIRSGVSDIRERNPRQNRIYHGWESSQIFTVCGNRLNEQLLQLYRGTLSTKAFNSLSVIRCV